MRYKRSAKRNIGVEIDPKIIKKWNTTEEVNFELVHSDAMEYLSAYPFNGKELVYCDPPYLRETRRSKKKIYKYEYGYDRHAEFLEFIKTLPCQVMISGYQSELYTKSLSNWRAYSFETTIRKRTSTEWIWMNYHAPPELHDYRYLGDNYRERERLRNIAARWSERLKSMSNLEQRALLSAIQSTVQERA